MITRNGRHQADTEGWWARKSRKSKVAILTVAFLGVATMAVAAILANIGISSPTFTFTVAEDVTVSVIDVVNPNPNCAGTAAADGQSFTVDTWTDFGPDASCVLRIRTEATSNGPSVYAVDLTIDNSDDDIPVTGVITGNCQGAIPTDGSNVLVDIALTVGPDPGVAGDYSWALAGTDSLVFADDPLDGDCDSST